MPGPLHLALERFFASRAPLRRGDGLVVAFSGGPDSTALLTALARWSEDRGVRVHAAHLDHGLDPDSADRARAAARMAKDLGVELSGQRLEASAVPPRGESQEAAARHHRYRFLEATRIASGARYVATAHHREDQAETVVLRILQGSGLTGLRAIAARRGRVVRPFLDRPRAELRRFLAAQGIAAIEDPTNADLSRPRNLVRQRILPLLAAGAPSLLEELARLAAVAGAATAVLERRLERELAPRPVRRGLEIEHRSFERLPAALRAAALSLLQRRAGAEFPPRAGALGEVSRQLSRHGRVRCDCGDGWRLESRAGVLALCREPAPAEPFAYTLSLPGEVDLPETAGALRLRRQQVEPWMFEPSSWRAGLSLPLAAGERITVRSRRPGDRIRPFGCAYERRLKDVLIDRKVPRDERDRLPLLCIGQRVIWAPGVTIDEGSRLTNEERAWVAEWRRA